MMKDLKWKEIKFTKEYPSLQENLMYDNNKEDQNDFRSRCQHRR